MVEAGALHRMQAHLGGCSAHLDAAAAIAMVEVVDVGSGCGGGGCGGGGCGGGD